MKATGIVRRIDDLGRVVVPKEIRRTLRIREGDPLEIFTDKDGSVVLKKYSPIGELSEYARDFSAAIERTIEKTVVICDKDSVVSASGEFKKEYDARPISRQLENIIEGRSAFVKTAQDSISVIPIYEGEDISQIAGQVIRPILSEGQTIGAVIVLSRDAKRPLGGVEEKCAEMAALFLGAQMEQ